MVSYLYNVVLNGKQEIEVLGAELKRSHDELDRSRADVSPRSSFETVGGVSAKVSLTLCVCVSRQTARLQRELCQSEIARVEAERKAARATDELTRLTDVSHQMEDISRENDLLTSRV